MVLEIEIQGAEQIRDTMPEAVQLFITPPEPALETLMSRLAGRGTDSKDAVAARMEVAQAELNARHEFHHQVLNDDLDRATDELESIVRRKLSDLPQ